MKYKSVYMFSKIIIKRQKACDLINRSSDRKSGKKLRETPKQWLCFRAHRIIILLLITFLQF